MQHIVETKIFHVESESEQINELLQKGWVMLETNKADMWGVSIAIGKPASVYIEELKSIIKDYEDAGAKEILLRHIADKYDEDYDSLNLDSGVYIGRSKTRDYYNRYKRLAK